MKALIPTKIHGVLDYLSGALFLISPWLFHFANGSAAQWVPIVLGALALLYSIFTNYEAGIIRLLSMPVHLTLDVLSGIVMASSPWLFNFVDVVYLPHLCFGLFEIGAGVFTQHIPSLLSRQTSTSHG